VGMSSPVFDFMLQNDNVFFSLTSHREGVKGLPLSRQFAQLMHVIILKLFLLV
jgi:hypothetical protein